MTATVFIDSNIWIYYHSRKPDHKFIKARNLILENFTSLLLSTQILGELYNILIRKKMASQSDAKQSVADLASEFPIVAINADQAFKAIDVNIRYEYSYWDSLIIATALTNHCSILYSEDMQHDQLIEDKLRIVNPFVKKLNWLLN